MTRTPQPHYMKHPGPPNPSRLDHVELANVVTEDVLLQPGQSLHNAIIGAAKNFGGNCGTASLEGGGLSKTRFTTGGSARDGKAANYTYIRDYGATELTMGTCSFGFAEDAPHFVHCHAKFSKNPHGSEIGGHFMAEDCMISEPIFAKMNVFIGNRITKCASAETLHAIFEIDEDQPKSENDGFGREYFIRVHPNEDLPTALETFCATQNIKNALVGSSLGSLNEPGLSHRGKILKVPSVGTEVLAFNGEVMVERDGSLSASLLTNLVNEAGTEFVGYLVKGQCPVCITAEIYLLEVLDPALLATMREVRNSSR